MEKLSLVKPPTLGEKGPDIRVGKLDSLSAIRKEQARLYRLTRKNHGKDIDAVTGSKLSFMLSQIAKVLVESQLEERLIQIEKKLVNGQS